MIKIPENTWSKFLIKGRKLPKGAASIYGLLDPDTGALRYIGYSKVPVKRYIQHCHHAEQNLKYMWIRSLRARNKVPTPVLLAVCSIPFAPTLEKAYIRAARADGLDLVNGTEGGDGVIPTEAVRRKMSENSKGKGKGRLVSKETRAKIRNSKLRHWADPEYREKMSAVLRAHAGNGIGGRLRVGTKQSPETIAKRVAKNRGKKRSPEQLQHMRNAWTPEMKEKARQKSLARIASQSSQNMQNNKSLGDKL